MINEIILAFSSDMQYNTMCATFRCVHFRERRCWRLPLTTAAVELRVTLTEQSCSRNKTISGTDAACAHFEYMPRTQGLIDRLLGFIMRKKDTPGTVEAYVVANRRVFYASKPENQNQTQGL